jgi:phosphoglycolate phosphatase
MRSNLLFDLDGTLTDPRPGLVRSVLAALERMGRELPHEADLNFIIGPPIQHSLATILETVDEKEIERCLGYFRERYSTVGLFENEVYPGIPEALVDLKSKGYHLYVATGKPKPFADRILERFDLDQYFVRAYGSRLDGSRIEKHEVIEDVLIAESIDPKTAIMVGDREHDVIGAKKHGIPTIGVLYGYGAQDELTGSGAVALCDHPGNLADLCVEISQK